MVKFSKSELRELKKEVDTIPNYGGAYILLVQRNENRSGAKRGTRGYSHVGYMNKLFSCKEDACLFYNIHNPHLRPMFADCHPHIDGVSDWDPKTRLRYRIIPECGDHLDIEPFDGIPSMVGDSGTGWCPQAISPVGTPGISLGPVMRKGPGYPSAEYPNCRGPNCWCYDCALDTTEYDVDKSDYNHKRNHLIQALYLAKELRSTYNKK